MLWHNPLRYGPNERKDVKHPLGRRYQPPPRTKTFRESVGIVQLDTDVDIEYKRVVTLKSVLSKMWCRSSTLSSVRAYFSIKRAVRRVDQVFFCNRYLASSSIFGRFLKVFRWMNRYPWGQRVEETNRTGGAQSITSPQTERKLTMIMVYMGRWRGVSSLIHSSVSYYDLFFSLCMLSWPIAFTSTCRSLKCR